MPYPTPFSPGTGVCMCVDPQALLKVGRIGGNIAGKFESSVGREPASRL